MKLGVECIEKWAFGKLSAHVTGSKKRKLQYNLIHFMYYIHDHICDHCYLIQLFECSVLVEKMHLSQNQFPEIENVKHISGIKASKPLVLKNLLMKILKNLFKITDQFEQHYVYHHKDYNPEYPFISRAEYLKT